MSTEKLHELYLALDGALRGTGAMVVVTDRQQPSESGRAYDERDLYWTATVLIGQGESMGAAGSIRASDVGPDRAAKVALAAKNMILGRLGDLTRLQSIRDPENE